MKIPFAAGHIQTLRLSCKQGFLSLAYLHLDPGLRSIVHGQERIKALAMPGQIPLLPSFPKNQKL